MSKISTVNQVKEHNIALVREVIHSSVEFTKHSIAQITGLSIATTNSILNLLCEAGEIVAVGNVSSTVGRPAAKYVYNRDFAHICCVFPSSAGSQRYLSYTVFDLLGNPVKQNQVWLEDVTYESFEELIGILIQKDSSIKKVSIGIPGYYDNNHIHSCTMTALNGCDLTGRLSKRFACEFMMENNMNAIAYGLYDARRAHGHTPAALVAVSFFEGGGPGSGIIIDGKIYLGKSNFAGEVVFLPYQDGNIYDLVKQGQESIVKSTAQVVCSYCAILNPETCVLTGENLSADLCRPILERCKRSIPEQHLPELLYVSNYNQYYQNGLFRIALNSPYHHSPR